MTKSTPPWVAPLFALLAAVTVPWTAYLSASLPQHIETHHYRVAWVGFDIGLALLLVATAFLAWRGIRQVALTATATATVLLVDAWLDVVTSPWRDLAGALASAGLIELPLAALCLWLALHVDRLIVRRLRQLERRAQRAATTTWPAQRGAWATRLAANLGRTGVAVERTGAGVADEGVRVAESEAQQGGGS